MIQVAVNPHQYPAVKEFFELFKTEWSVYDPSRPCTVLITDDTAPLDAKAELCLCFTPAELPDDFSSRRADISGCGFRLSELPDGKELPLYTELRLFSEIGDTLIKDKSTGLAIACSGFLHERKTIRIGYDLFDEISRLLSSGQPPENAGYPSLDRHIEFIRQSILGAGFPVVEIPPCPAGHDFMVCLTHDVDFVSIRNHGFDRTVRGFIYRAVIGSVQRFIRHRLTLRQVLKNWQAVLLLPLVHLGVCKDFWMQFESYRRIEGRYRSTWFLIPFKGRSGRNVSEEHPGLRATRYDVTDVGRQAVEMQAQGCEIGLHGIDAWCDRLSARLEKNRISSVTGNPDVGVRMHWLCNDRHSLSFLDEAGFEYDATNGYNETIGFRAGTSQVFKPFHAHHLLEIPLHIQDVALFYPVFLDLNEADAWTRCMDVFDHQKVFGGVVTLLWHMRSLAPERLWGGFYKRLLQECRSTNAWVGTARDVVDWFRARREMKLSVQILPDDQLSICAFSGAEPREREVTIRVYHPGGAPRVFTDVVWRGQAEVKISMYKETE